MAAHARMLADAEDLVNDAYNMYKTIMEHEPHREPLARAILDDTVRVYGLVAESKRPTIPTRLLIASLLVRASAMAEALNAPLQ